MILKENYCFSLMITKFGQRHYLNLDNAADQIWIMALTNKLVEAPKKAKKLIFNDPFIYHAVYAWLHPSDHPYEAHIKTALMDPQLCSVIVESCVVAHYKRKYPTFYIKAEGEVDVAYIDQQKFWPVEVKWTGQVRASDLKQIQKYSNGILLSRQTSPAQINATPSYSLPWYLAKYL